MGDKYERYRNGHESHYIRAAYIVWSTPRYMRLGQLVGNEIRALCALIAHPTSGGTQNGRSTVVAETVIYIQRA